MLKVELPRRWAGVASTLGLALIAGSVALVSVEADYPGLALVLPVLGACLVVAARDSPLNVRLLASRPAVFIGLVSYPLYLWHWPLLALLRNVDRAPSSAAIGATLALAALLAVATWWIIERPLVRLPHRSRLRGPRSRACRSHRRRDVGARRSAPRIEPARRRDVRRAIPVPNPRPVVLPPEQGRSTHGAAARRQPRASSLRRHGQGRPGRDRAHDRSLHADARAAFPGARGCERHVRQRSLRAIDARTWTSTSSTRRPCAGSCSRACGARSTTPARRSTTGAENGSPRSRQSNRRRSMPTSPRSRGSSCDWAACPSRWCSTRRAAAWRSRPSGNVKRRCASGS